MTCLSTPAIHIERHDDMTIVAFINSLRYVIAICDPSPTNGIQLLWPDFRGPAHVLKVEKEDNLEEDHMKPYLLSQNCITSWLW